MLGDVTATDLVILAISILVSLTLHEMMHAFVGHALGDDTAAEQGRISLNPLAHIDPLMTVLLPIITLVIFHVPVLAAKPVPFNPERLKWGDYGAALIAIAGPLTNLLLAALTVLIWRLVGGGALFEQFVATFFSLNVTLFVFNMVPIPPLDGSRVLYAFAPDSLRDVMDRIEPYGLFVVFGLVLAGFGSLLGFWVDSVSRFLQVII